jgi:nicotinamidase-related amidase
MLLAVMLSAAGLASTAQAQTIIDDWNGVKAPAAPALKPVTVDTKTTALLMLDFMKQNCGKRPRCVASVPTVKMLLDKARAAGVAVVYSIIANSTVADIVDKSLAPAANEPAVLAGPDKFYKTELEKILKDKGISTVIVVGTAAEGAVLYTASSAAFRGLKVIVPVDGMSSQTAYAEQYVAWHLVNGPTVSKFVTLTKVDMIKF